MGVSGPIIPYYSPVWLALLILGVARTALLYLLDLRTLRGGRGFPSVTFSIGPSCELLGSGCLCLTEIARGKDPKHGHNNRAIKGPNTPK